MTYLKVNVLIKSNLFCMTHICNYNLSLPRAYLIIMENSRKQQPLAGVFCSIAFLENVYISQVSLFRRCLRVSQGLKLDLKSTPVQALSCDSSEIYRTTFSRTPPLRCIYLVCILYQSKRITNYSQIFGIGTFPQILLALKLQ